MKRFFRIISVALVVAICFGATACSKGGQQDTFEDVINWDKVDWEGNNDKSNAIKVYISNDLQDYYAGEIAKFEEAFPQYDVTVIWGAAGDGVKSAQTTALSTGNPPDLVLGGDVHIENQKGFLLPLNKLVERDNDEVDGEDFMPEIMDGFYSGEGLYYLPTSFNVSLLMYNKTLFDADSVAYPTDSWTYNDFTTAAKSLVKYGSDGASTQWGSQTVADWWTQWYSIYTQDGGSLFDEDGYLSLNNAKGIAALTMWRDWAGVQGQSNASFPNKIGTHNGTDGGNLGNFAGGKVSMLLSAHAGQLMTFSNAPNLSFDIAPMPKSNVTGSRDGTELSATAYGIHKSSKNKKGAWEMLKWLTRKREDISDLIKFANPVPRISERDLLLAVPKAERQTKYKNIEVIYDAVSSSRYLPCNLYFEEVVMQYVVPEINKMLDGTNTPTQAVQKAEQNANAYIEYQYKSSF